MRSSPADRTTRRLLERLPVAERQVLQLRLLQRLTTRQTARRLQLPEPQVRRLQRAGLEWLRHDA